MEHTYMIVDAQDPIILISKMSKYDISMLGTLTVINGQYKQSFLGAPKVEKKLPAKRKSRAKVKPKVTKEIEVDV